MKRTITLLPVAFLAPTLAGMDIAAARPEISWNDPVAVHETITSNKPGELTFAPFRGATSTMHAPGRARGTDGVHGSDQFSRRFFTALKNFDYMEVAQVLRDWDTELLLLDNREGRLSIAKLAYKLGGELAGWNKPKPALSLLGLALDIHHEIGGDNEHQVLIKLASIHLAGKRPESAEIYLKQAIALLEQQPHAVAALQSSLKLLVEAYNQQGRHAEARAVDQRLNVLAAPLGPGEKGKSVASIQHPTHAS